MQREILTRGLVSLMLLFVFGSEFVLSKHDEEHDERRNRSRVIAVMNRELRRSNLPMIEYTGTI